MTDPKARRQKVQRVIRCEVDSLGLVFAVNAFVNGPQAVELNFFSLFRSWYCRNCHYNYILVRLHIL